MSGFKREIKLYDAVMLVSGSMIGSGIFVVSADVARQTGASGWLLASWLLAGILTLIGALSYGELTSMYPHAGGQYVFLQKAYGKLLAFLYGWSFFAVIQTGTIAAVAVAFSKYTGVLFPGLINDTNEWFALGDTSFKLTSQRFLAILSILLLTWLNTKGVKEGKLIQNVFSTTKIGAILLLIVLGFALGSNTEVIKANFTDMFEASKSTVDNGILNTTSLTFFGIILALGVTQVGTLFSSDAWNGLTFAGDEVVNPTKTIPRGMAIGTLLVVGLYFIMNLSYLFILPLKGDPNGVDVMSRGIQFASEDRVAAATAIVIGGAKFAIFTALLIMISTFGCNNGLILSGARVYYTMAKDGLFFKNFGKLNKNGVPQNALWWQGIWASVLCLTGKYGDLLDYFMGVVILFYAFTILGIFILRKKEPNLERPVKAPLFPFLPAFYIFLAFGLVIILFKEKPQFTIPGLIIVALGIPVFYWFKKKSTE
ncbi:MAG: amino acid permease [Cytophagaceae bacterium]|nr:amino acid permease [Cytophagaceae bacterium]MBL0301493.1 amino acid permease [Cytophagaceae bacterium]MBL0324314.1 amino acid permease [Cytophagaceae bacterium]